MMERFPTAQPLIFKSDDLSSRGFTYLCESTLSVFNVMELKPGPTENYEIGLDGVLKMYVTDYGCKKHRDLRKLFVPEEKVRTFFKELRELLVSAKYEYERIDDTTRDIRITYSARHYEVISADVEDADGNSVERLFWDFIHSVEN